MTVPGIYRSRPGAEAIQPATEGPAEKIGNDIWMSPGVSYSFAIGTDDGRIIINAGLPFEGPIRRRAYDAVVPGNTRTIIVTQGHADHVGGVNALRDESTDVVMQSNWRMWKGDAERLTQYKVRNAAFAWQHTIEAMIKGMMSLPPEARALSWPEPTITFDKRLELTVGGRRLELISTPGGETTDAMIVWLPDEKTVFTGNLFGPLFGHVPNLMTIRGDRYRDALAYIDCANKVLALGAERLVTGHFAPIEGASLIAEEVTNLRDAMQAVHDQVVDGMELGTDVYTLMRDVRTPAALDIGEGYGKTSWNVRAIWENYAGWFHHRSTTELYGVAPSAIAADLVQVAGADALVAIAAKRVGAGEFVEAIHLLEIVLSAEPEHIEARRNSERAHDALLKGSTNFWEKAWLRRAADQLRP